MSDPNDSNRIDMKELYRFMGSIDERTAKTNDDIQELKTTIQQNHEAAGQENDAQWKRINSIDKQHEQFTGSIKALKAMWAALTAAVGAAISWFSSNQH